MVGRRGIMRSGWVVRIGHPNTCRRHRMRHLRWATIPTITARPTDQMLATAMTSARTAPTWIITQIARHRSVPARTTALIIRARGALMRITVLLSAWKLITALIIPARVLRHLSARRRSIVSRRIQRHLRTQLPNTPLHRLASTTRSRRTNTHRRCIYAENLISCHRQRRHFGGEFKAT
jgi:hypothetical protein